MWAVHWRGEKPVVGAIRVYHVVAIYMSFGNGLHSIPLFMTAGPCPSRLPEVLSSVYCPKSKCAVARHGGPRDRILASFLHRRCTSVTHTSMDAQAHPWECFAQSLKSAYAAITQQSVAN